RRRNPPQRLPVHPVSLRSRIPRACSAGQWRRATADNDKVRAAMAHPGRDSATAGFASKLPVKASAVHVHVLVLVQPPCGYVYGPDDGRRRRGPIGRVRTGGIPFAECLPYSARCLHERDLWLRAPRPPARDTIAATANGRGAAAACRHGGVAHAGAV